VKDWTYLGAPITEIPDGVVGFVYLITNQKTGQGYIGKKFCWSRRRKKVAGRKNRKVVIKESDWRNYWSSSEDVKDVVAKVGKKHFTREILFLGMNKRSVSYVEVEQQFKRDVLTAKLSNGLFAYYNSNIAGKWYRASSQLNVEKPA
jgi:hypothetical protein